MRFKCEKLNIWKDVMILGEDINSLTDTFPKKELYNLSSQIRRAIHSIALNISERSILQSDPEQKRFLGYSIRSLAGVVTCLYKAKNRSYINDEIFKKKSDFCYKLINKMIAYRNKFNS